MLSRGTLTSAHKHGERVTQTLLPVGGVETGPSQVLTYERRQEGRVEADGHGGARPREERSGQRVLVLLRERDPLEAPLRMEDHLSSHKTRS